MNTYQLSSQSQLGSYKLKIQSFLSESQNSVSSIIKKAAQNEWSIEQCLETIVNECNVKQKTMEAISQICVQLCEKLQKAYQLGDSYQTKLLYKSEELKALKRENSSLKQGLKEQQNSIDLLHQKLVENQYHYEEQLNAKNAQYLEGAIEAENKKYQSLSVDFADMEIKLQQLNNNFNGRQQQIMDLNKQIEQMQRQSKMKDYHIKQVQDSYFTIMDENKRLSDENRILCEQLKEFYSQRNVSTTQFSESQKSNSLFSSLIQNEIPQFIPQKVYLNVVEQENPQKNDIKADKEQEINYRVKTLQRFSSAGSFQSLKMESLGSFKHFNQTVSVGTMTQVISPFFPIHSKAKKINQMADSMVLDRINSQQLKSRMAKKDKKQIICISTCEEQKSNNKSFINCLIHRRTHKTKVSESILEIEERKKKNNLSFIQNNTFTQKIVSSRIKNKVNQSLTQSNVKNTNFFDSLSKVVVRGRIKK